MTFKIGHYRMRSFQQKVIRGKDCSISTLKNTYTEYKSMQCVPGIVKYNDTSA